MKEEYRCPSKVLMHSSWLRAAELAKETSNQIKRMILRRNILIYRRLNLKGKKQMVAKTNVTENLRLHPDKDNSGDNTAAYKRKQKKRKTVKTF